MDEFRKEMTKIGSLHLLFRYTDMYREYTTRIMEKDQTNV